MFGLTGISLRLYNYFVQRWTGTIWYPLKESYRTSALLQSQSKQDEAVQMYFVVDMFGCVGGK